MSNIIKRLTEIEQHMRRRAQSWGRDGLKVPSHIYRNKKTARMAIQEIERMSREIEVLRQYGNKDCTAMADEALASDICDKGES